MFCALLNTSSGHGKRKKSKKRDLERVCHLGMCSMSIMNNDKEEPTRQDIKTQEGIIGYEVPRQYPAQYYREGYKNLKMN